MLRNAHSTSAIGLNVAYYSMVSPEKLQCKAWKAKEFRTKALNRNRKKIEAAAQRRQAQRHATELEELQKYGPLESSKWPQVKN